MKSIEFLNCDMEFECPKDWDEMLISDNANIRHCSACSKDVHFCHTIEDLKNAIDAKYCVTYISSKLAGNTDELEQIVSNVENLKKSELRLSRVTRTTGIPYGYKGAQSLFEPTDDGDQ